MRRSIPHLLALALCLLLAAPALAQEGGGDAPPGEGDRARGETMSPIVAKKLQAIQEAMQGEKTDVAQKLLGELAQRRGLRPIEQATIYMLYGYIANEREDTPKAIAYFKKAIELDVLPLSQQFNLEWSIGQLYATEGRFDKALEVQREWLKKAMKPDSPVRPQGSHFYMFALSYMQLDPPQPQNAQRPAEIAVNSTEEPQENWLRLLGQVYYTRGDYAKMAEVLEKLVVLYNKPEYYTQLSGAYAESGQEKKALAVLQLAYSGGLLKKEREVIQLARMYLYHEMPHRAGTVQQ